MQCFSIYAAVLCSQSPERLPDLLHYAAFIANCQQTSSKQLQQQTREWRGKKEGLKWDLLSLVGTLTHAYKAVRQDRSFLRRLIDVAKQVRRLDHHVRLNISARSDIQWWFQFAANWNGVSMLLEQRKLNPDIVTTLDTSSNWGCGAYCRDSWFQLEWNEATKQKHLTIKELIPIVLAAALWGESWSGKSVQVHCDNAAVVAVINSGSSKRSRSYAPDEMPSVYIS